KRLRTTHSRWRLWCVMLLAVFIGTASSFGQQDITWQSLSSDDLYRNGLDEDKKLTFYFQAEKTAATAEIQITLPKGVKVTAATPVVATGAGNDYTFGTATAAPSGDKTIVTIPITGGINNGEVGSGTLKVLANGDAAVGTAAITAKVVAAGITDAGQSANVKVENPQLNLIYTKPADGSDYVGGAEHKIVLTSTKGKAKMTTIVLTVDDSFTLDEASFTAGTVVKSGNKYTLTFTNEVLSISGKELKFKSKHPVMGGNRSIKCEIKTDCNVSKVENLNFLVPVADVGTTNLSILKVEFVGNDNGTPVKPSSSLCYETGTHPTMDGSLVFVKSTLKNTGTGAIGFFRVEQNGYPGGLFYHKVGETAYYQIDNGPLKAVPANMHQYKLGGEWLSYMTEVPLPAGVDQWSRHLTLYIYDEVPAGKEVVVYFPGHYGKIYLDDAASNKKNILTDSRDYHIGARIWVKEVKNKNGDNGVSGAVYSAYKDSPRFYERAEGLTFTDENPTDQTQIIKEEVQMNLRTGYVGTGSEYASTLKIDHPAWLEIENVELNELSYAGGTPLFSVNPTGTPGEYTINRSDAYKGGLKLLLKCSYKVKQDAKPTGNASGEIKYSLTQKLTINSAVVSTLETSRLIQPVHYVRDFNGIKLQSFELKRDKSSQGYAPLNNEKGGAVADGTTDPTQNLIDHTIYIAEDKGAFVWNVELIDAVNVGESIFLPLETNNFALGVSSDGLTFDTPLIGGVPNPALSYKKVDDQRGYLQYTPTAKLNGSSVLTFTLPFTVKGQRNATRPITSNALIGASSDNPITPTGTLKGNSVMSLSMGTYNLEPQFDALIEGVNFPSATTQKDLYVYMYTFWSNYLPAPHFPYEVRSLAYPSKLIVKVPKGYTLEKLSLKKYGRTVTESKNEAGSADLLTGLTADTSDPEYDVYTTNIGDLYGPGKTWPYPDEKWEQCLDYKLQASTRVKAASKISFEVKYSNPITGKDVLNTTKSRELTYSGPSISLETLATLQPADKAVTEMDVKFINTSTSTVKDNWLMLEGDFDGLVLVGGTTSDVVEGKFVKVSPSIVSKGTQSVSLKFNYKGTDGGTIKVTPLSGWTAAYTPSGTPSDNNMGVGKTVTIQPLANKLDASLKVDNVMFKEGETYKLTATLSSESSAGDISNPTMEITVPAGQEVKSAVATYNGITYTLTAAEFNAAFPLAGDKFTFDIRKVIAGTPANITFPGFNSQPNLDEQIATLEITYEPKSGTPTDGTMHFTGTAQASGVNAGAITASVESQKMAPRLDLANMLTVSVTSANKAFSSVSNTYDLIVEVEVSKKTSSFDVNDYMELDIPKYLTVGTPTVTSGTTSVTDTDDSGASRLVKLVLPIGNLNSVGDKITYTIPVTYDGVGAEQALPKKTLVAKYMTKTAIFGNNQIVAASTSSLDVLFVKTNAVSIFADQTPGETLTIESNGVTGKFDGGAAASSKVVTAAHSTQNDIAAAAGFTAKETVEVIYETQSYGMVDLPYTVYPSLVYTLSSNTFTDCGTVTVPFSTLVTAKTATNTTVKFYSDAACTSEITDASKAYTNSTTVYAFATNQGNPNVSTAKAITITVNANLGVTIAPATTTLTAGNSFTLTTSLTGTAPSGAKYKWYKGVAPSGTYVTTTTVPTYTKDNAAIADGGSYYVVVLNNDETSTGICGNTSSNAATVSVVAAPPAVTFVGSASDYVFCDVVSGGLTLWDAISSDKSTT
ncbi:hypothetical protein, partial [Parabacteroides sp. 52]|uniref:hypothetical protein n=1 Tax=Parabacteroides sp. 52 TaxID=2302940 RepID=UPI001943D243